MRRNSKIFTNASGTQVIGGNINIDTDVLAAFENSDISADSANFRGGRVRINTQGIFGIKLRDVASDKTSDITATGINPEFSGTVELNIPEVEPNNGLIELPAVSTDTQVRETCTGGASQAQSEFLITRRGGLPYNPRVAFSNDTPQVDWVTRTRNGNQRNIQITKDTSYKSEPIVEASGWIKNVFGEVFLTAKAPATPGKLKQAPISCTR